MPMKNYKISSSVLLLLLTTALVYRAFYDKEILPLSELTNIPPGNILSLDAVYVINLERSRDRLATMTQELNRAELNFSRFNAIDGNVFKNRYQKLPKQVNFVQKLGTEKTTYTYKFDPQINPYGLSIGELGNYFSHYEILKIVSAENHQASLILEDDARLTQDFKLRLTSLLAHAPKEWDIIYLNCFAELDIGCRPKKLPLTWDKRFSKLNRHCTAGNGAYLINAHGARKLLTDALPATNRTDERIGHDFFSQKKMQFNAYCAHPELVRVGDDGSIIDEMGRHL